MPGQEPRHVLQRGRTLRVLQDPPPSARLHRGSGGPHLRRELQPSYRVGPNIPGGYVHVQRSCSLRIHRVHIHVTAGPQNVIRHMEASVVCAKVAAAVAAWMVAYCPSDMLVSLRDGSAHTTARAATLS